MKGIFDTWFRSEDDRKKTQNAINELTASGVIKREESIEDVTKIQPEYLPGAIERDINGDIAIEKLEGKDRGTKSDMVRLGLQQLENENAIENIDAKMRYIRANMDNPQEIKRLEMEKEGLLQQRITLAQQEKNLTQRQGSVSEVRDESLN